MKRLTFFPILILALICLPGGNQANASVKQNFNDTITTAPVGTVIKDGKLIVAKGYKYRYSVDGVSVSYIYRVSDGRVMYAVKDCPCGTYKNTEGNLRCSDCPWHGWIISIGEVATDGKTTWKTLVTSKTKTTTSSN